MPKALLLRFFLLTWIVLVGAIALNMEHAITQEQGKRCVENASLSFCQPQPLMLQSNTWLSLCLFVFLLALYGVGLWIVLSRGMSLQRSSLVVLFLGIDTLLIGIVTQQENLIFNLCLTLILGALAIRYRPCALIMIACGSLALIGSSMILIRPTTSLEPAWSNMWSLTGAPALIVFLIGYLALYIQQRQAHTQLEAAHTQLQAFIERIEDLTRLSERQRLARELHDSLAQGLAGLTMQIQAASSQLAAGDYLATQAVHQQMLTSAREALGTARATIHELRTITAPTDLFETIQDDIHRIASATRLCVTMQDMDLLLCIPPAACEPVFYVIRESVLNVARHAQARQVWLRLAKKQDRLTIEIQDDGIGFDPLHIEVHDGHYGLLGLYERTRLIGGQFAISSAPGQGTIAHFVIPIRTAKEGIND